MKKNYGFDTEFNKLKGIAWSLWMGFKRGEGELEIEDQGRLQKSRFTQETVAIGQQAPRIGEDRLKLRFSKRESSAGCTLNSSSTPQFFSSIQKTQNTLQQILQAASRDEDSAV